MHSLKVVTVLAVLLAIILTTGLYASSVLSSSAKKMEEHVTKIEDETRGGNWSKAGKQLSDAKSDWSGMEKRWAVLIDHMEIDNIDTALTKMEKYIDTQNASLALAEAASLKLYIKHIPAKEAFNLKNIL